MPSIPLLHQRMSRLPFGILFAALFLSQHAVTLFVVDIRGRAERDFLFALAPIRELVTQSHSPEFAVLWMAYTLAVTAGLAFLAFRRAADAGIDGWIASMAIVPGLQVFAWIILSFVPSRQSDTPPEAPHSGLLNWAVATQGVIAGIALTIVAVALGALAFGTYGWGVFVCTPFLVGLVTGYIANRHHLINSRETFLLAMGACALGGVALVLAALEGAVCLVMAAPIALPFAGLGALLARSVMGIGGRRSPPVMCFAVLPLLFFVEQQTASLAAFGTREEDRKSVV